jgi:hypothetical protein
MSAPPVSLSRAGVVASRLTPFAAWASRETPRPRCVTRFVNPVGGVWIQSRWCSAVDGMGGPGRLCLYTPFLHPVAGPLRHPGRGCVLLAGDTEGFCERCHGGRHLLGDGIGRPRGARRYRMGRRTRSWPAGTHAWWTAKSGASFAIRCGFATICWRIDGGSREWSPPLVGVRPRAG